VEFILPSDVIVADKFAADANTKVVSTSAIPDGWMGLDNGPEATKEIQASPYNMHIVACTSTPRKAAAIAERYAGASCSSSFPHGRPCVRPRQRTRGHQGDPGKLPPSRRLTRCV
jgi:Phosphoglycerate kinase